MIGLVAMLLACASGPPQGLVQELSAIHDVPPLSELSTRYPEVEQHLVAIAQDRRMGPIARDRAWALLATSAEVDVATHAVHAVADPEVPDTTRYKMLVRLASHHPHLARELVPAADCDDSRTLQKAARTARATLEASNVLVDPASCHTEASGSPDPE